MQVYCRDLERIGVMMGRLAVVFSIATVNSASYFTVAMENRSFRFFRQHPLVAEEAI